MQLPTQTISSNRYGLVLSARHEDVLGSRLASAGVRPMDDCHDNCDAAYDLCKLVGGSDADCRHARDVCYLYCAS